MKAKRDSFGVLVQTCRNSIKYDPWTVDRGIEGYCEEMIDEIKELKSAVSKKDHKNISEELGDILLDWVHLSLLVEDNHKLKIRDIIEESISKLERRKPYMKEKKVVTKEQALKIWNQVKKEEKARGIK